jgi:hypothetical protein
MSYRSVSVFRASAVWSVFVCLGLVCFASPAHALYGNSAFYWPGANGAGPVVIPVCWENPGAVAAERLGWVRSAIQSNYDRYTRVIFTEWDTCTSARRASTLRSPTRARLHRAASISTG